MATLIHILYEHATGYALFKVKEFEEVAMLLTQVEASITDLSKFNSIVKLVAFSAFKSGSNALDNINSISEGIVHEDLRLFLETNMPSATKKHTSILGVSDRKIADSIAEELGLKCQHTGLVPEVVRGLRVHFPKLIKGLSDQSESKAQLGLGHSYSRAKVKFNVNRIDNMIIQSISLLDQLDKDINTFSMRIREWYSYHFPELAKIVPDSHLYAQVTHCVGDRKQLDEEKLAELEQLVGDASVAQAVVDASKSSMGMDISPIDLVNIEVFAKRVIGLGNYRKSLQEYLRSKMSQVAPSLAQLIGDVIGARLISHAGSLTNLAKYPASTVQILGAEKALFRALKSRGNTPKYGIIFHSSFIGRAGMKNKGRISRYLANKCSIASRIDCFSDIPTTVFGDFLRQQVEDRLTFYSSGEIPEKNVDVMKKASEKAGIEQAKIAKKLRKKKRKSSLAAATDISTLDESVVDDTETKENTKKKKKKSLDQSDENGMEVSVEGDDSVVLSEKKKKRKKSMVEGEDQEEKPVEDADVEPAKKKKKKRSMSHEDDGISEKDQELVEVVADKAKKKKKKSILPEDNAGASEEDQPLVEVVADDTKKKKKKSMSREDTAGVSEGDETLSAVPAEEQSTKIKKNKNVKDVNPTEENEVVSPKKKKKSLGE